MSAAPHPLISAALAMPKTHAVVTTFADGTTRRFETRNYASANTHADFVERPKIGRELINRDTGEKVRVVAVDIVEL